MGGIIACGRLMGGIIGDMGNLQSGQLTIVGRGDLDAPYRDVLTM